MCSCRKIFASTPRAEWVRVDGMVSKRPKQHVHTKQTKKDAHCTQHERIDGSDDDDDKTGLSIYFNFASEKRQRSQHSFGVSNGKCAAQNVYDFR